MNPIDDFIGCYAVGKKKWGQVYRDYTGKYSAHGMEGLYTKEEFLKEFTVFKPAIVGRGIRYVRYDG